MSKRALFVHAHPDDETINNGVTMAKYAEQGYEVALVTCTRGEEGEILVPELAVAASDREDRLAEIREVELANALRALGVDRHWFLGSPNRQFRDSGMMGMPQNSRSDVFWNADVSEAAELLAQYIIDFKPHVMITYDEFGGYGHPDHIKAHKVAMRASELAAEKNFGKGELWDIPKIYWNIMPRSVVEEGMKQMKDVGADLFGSENIDDLPFVKPDELVTAAIEGEAFLDKKMAALAEHKTQINLDEPFFALQNSSGKNVWGTEYYTQVKGEKSKKVDARGYVTDLFD